MNRKYAENNSEKNTKTTPKSGKNSGKNMKPKFNFYWIYGIIILVFLAFNFLNWGSGPQETNWGDLKEMLRSQEVKKLVLVNKEYAEIFLTEEALKQEKYKDVQPGTSTFGESQPQYVYTIGSVDKFYEQVEEAQKGLDNPIFINNEKRSDWTGQILGWIIPFLLLIGVWFFFMRMMSRGGPGGGQIFNIGKSKAQLFDKENTVTVDFHDVAGLDEAKIEVMEIVDFLKSLKIYKPWG